MATGVNEGLNVVELSLRQKFGELTWGLILLLCVTACIGFAMLYSAANGSYEPWAWRQMVRFGVGLTMMLVLAMIDIRVWLRYAYVIYALALALLALVEVMGIVGMGAQRWVDLRIVQLQPSEIMKVALVLALARYFMISEGCGSEWGSR